MPHDETVTRTLYYFEELSEKAKEEAREWYREGALDYELVDNLIEALTDFNSWIFKSLEKEYEYLMSDESVDESIKANEYEFTEDGERA